MKTKRWRNKVHHRRSGLQRYAWKITVTRKIFLLDMAADRQPVFCGPQQEDRMFSGFQFEDGQTAGACD